LIFDKREFSVAAADNSAGTGRRKVGIIARRSRFISAARLIAGLTFTSRILGLVRDGLCLGYFGANIWHYFALAFQVPNLFRRLFGEGALAAALIPVYTEQLERDESSANLLARSVISLLVIILGGLTLLGWVLIYLFWYISSYQPTTFLMLSLAAIMLPYMILICSVAAIGALLNVQRHFAAPAAAPIVLNICIIGGVLWFRNLFGSDPWRQIYVVAVAVLIGGVGQLLLQYPALRRAGISLLPRFHFFDVGLGKIMRLMAPMMIGLAAVQINTLLDSLIAYFLSATPESGSTFFFMGHTFGYPVVEGSLSFLYGAQRLYQVPLGIFGLALGTAVFPLLSSQAVQKDRAGFSESLSGAIRMVVFIAVPACVGLILVREPLVEAIFQRLRFTAGHAHETAETLFFYALGLMGYFFYQLVVRAFYAFQDSATPVKVALWTIGLNVVLNLVLIWPLGTGGLALSTAICATLQAAVLLSLLVRYYQLRITQGLWLTLIKTSIATAVMAGGFLLTWQWTGQAAAWVQVIIGVPVCIILYIVASLALKNTEIFALLRRS